MREPTMDEVKAALKGLGLPSTPECVKAARQALIEKATNPGQPIKALDTPAGREIVKGIHDQSDS